MDTRRFKSERTHCNIIRRLSATRRRKEPFPVDYSPSACVNTRFHGFQPYDHTKEAAQDSSAQKWSLNNAHCIHKHYPWICVRDMAVDSILLCALVSSVCRFFFKV